MSTLNFLLANVAMTTPMHADPRRREGTQVRV